MRIWMRTGAVALALAVGMSAGLTSVAPAEPVQQAQRAQMRHFSVLRTDPEGLPFWQQTVEEAEKAEAVDPHAQLLRGCSGLNAQLAQKIEGIPGRRVFLIPGDGCMELVNLGPVERPYPILSGVRTTEEAIKHGIETGGFRVGFGIVPDGVIAAKLSPTLTLPVRHETFYVVPYRRLDVASLWTKARLIFGASAGGR
jgi:hypothetical protein